MTEQYRPIKLMCKTLPSLKAAKVSESSFLTAYQLGMCVLDCLLRFGFGCFFFIQFGMSLVQFGLKNTVGSDITVIYYSHNS